MECPKCKSKKIARIIYGEPSMNKAMREQLKEGSLILGGCDYDKKMPSRHCNACQYEWKEEFKEFK